MILSIMSFRKVMVLIIWLIFSMFPLINPLEMLAMEMTSFKTLDWLIWLSYSFLTSCFIDLTSLSLAVPNKKWNNPLKGNKDLFILKFLGLWILSSRLRVSIWVEVISLKTELMSSIVIFNSREYLWSFLWSDSEYLVNIASPWGHTHWCQIKHPYMG